MSAASWIEIAKAALGLGLDAWRIAREAKPASPGTFPRIRTADELLLEAAKRRTGGVR